MAKSNHRWRSDRSEFRYENGEPLRVTFALFCCNGEAMSWVGTTGGYSDAVFRDVMLAAVEQRFGIVPKAPAEIQWLRDNGSDHIAGRTRDFSTNIGLKLLMTPVCTPQSNGMAEGFVKIVQA